MALPVETFFLHPEAQGTLQQQIQQMIAQGILSGRFRQGEKLPSTRKLASHLGVSRITVTIAYTELQANDYLVSRGRSGYFVSENAPAPPAFALPEKSLDAVDWSRAIGQRFAGGRPVETARLEPLPLSIYLRPSGRDPLRPCQLASLRPSSFGPEGFYRPDDGLWRSG